ncbi:MAG: hypothetical protein ABIZ04_07315 [Opitutus sp.]
MTTIAHCNTIDEALLLRSVLEGSGIPSFVPDELIAQTAPQNLFATVNRVRLQVAEEHVVKARETLDAMAQIPPEPSSSS